jgi:hypothetical protein
MSTCIPKWPHCTHDAPKTPVPVPLPGTVLGAPMEMISTHISYLTPFSKVFSNITLGVWHEGR